MLIEDKMLQY